MTSSRKVEAISRNLANNRAENMEDTSQRASNFLEANKDILMEYIRWNKAKPINHLAELEQYETDTLLKTISRLNDTTL